jgi:hypothetical protein
MLTREKAKSVVLELLKCHGLSQALRGSWKYDDFHLSKDGSHSLSDLDLVMNGVSDDARHQQAEILQNELSTVLALRVSIHGGDSLLEMNLSDSFVLNMGEFIAKTSRIDPERPEYSYTLAKISLLMLRNFTPERYINVSKRIHTCEAETAIAVKLGEETYFPTQAASKLLSLSCHSTVEFFLSNCVHRSPNQETIDLVKEQVRKCRSIAPWLQNYLISKIDSGVPKRICRQDL